jgi:hypothetical protein
MRSGCSFAQQDRTGIPPPAGAGFPHERHPGLVERVAFFAFGPRGDAACPLGKGRDRAEVLANVLLAGDAHWLGPPSALMMVAPNSVSGVVMGWTRRGCRAAIVRSDAPHLPISRERSSPLPEGVMTARQQGNSARAPTEVDRGG